MLQCFMLLLLLSFNLKIKSERIPCLKQVIRLLTLEESIAKFQLEFNAIRQHLLNSKIDDAALLHSLTPNVKYCKASRYIKQNSSKFELILPISNDFCAIDNYICLRQEDDFIRKLLLYQSFYYKLFEELNELIVPDEQVFLYIQVYQKDMCYLNITDICLTNDEISSEFEIIPIKNTNNECPVFQKMQCDSFYNTTDADTKVHNQLVFQNKIDYYRDYLIRYETCSRRVKEITIMRRFNGETDFYRNWSDYELGFGDPSKEFWIGNSKLHNLTTNNKYSLRIELEDWNLTKVYASYGHFKVKNSSEGYQLMIKDYKGTAGDSLSAHNNCKFSTYDKDNDEAPETLWNGSCAKRFHSGWWFKSCYRSNLNGKYYHSEKVDTKMNDGISWNTWLGHKYSLKSVEMKLIEKNGLI